MERQKMTVDRVIQVQKLLLRHGIDERHLQCLHLFNRQTDKASSTKLFGVVLCEQCNEDIYPPNTSQNDNQ